MSPKLLSTDEIIEMRGRVHPDVHDDSCDVCAIFSTMAAMVLYLDIDSEPRDDLGRWTTSGDSTVDHDDYTQVRNLYMRFDDAHRDRLTTRIAGALGHARKEVQLRQLCHFFRVDPDYGTRVATKLGVDLAGMTP